MDDTYCFNQTKFHGKPNSVENKTEKSQSKSVETDFPCFPWNLISHPIIQSTHAHVNLILSLRQQMHRI